MIVNNELERGTEENQKRTSVRIVDVVAVVWTGYIHSIAVWSNLLGSFLLIVCTISRIPLVSRRGHDGRLTLLKYVNINGLCHISKWSLLWLKEIIHNIKLSRYNDRLWAPWPRNQVQFPAEARNFSLFHSIQTGSGSHPACYSMGTGWPHELRFECEYQVYGTGRKVSNLLYRDV
jgi:hypothetical protein